LNAHCARQYSGGHACSSVISTIKPRACVGDLRLPQALKTSGGLAVTPGVVDLYLAQGVLRVPAVKKPLLPKVDLGSGRKTR